MLKEKKNPLQRDLAAADQSCCLLTQSLLIKQTKFYRMGTGLCSKSNVLCHTELLDMPKLQCQVSHTDMAAVSRAVHHNSSLESVLGSAMGSLDEKGHGIFFIWCSAFPKVQV